MCRLSVAGQTSHGRNLPKFAWLDFTFSGGGSEGGLEAGSVVCRCRHSRCSQADRQTDSRLAWAQAPPTPSSCHCCRTSAPSGPLPTRSFPLSSSCPALAPLNPLAVVDRNRHTNADRHAHCALCNSCSSNTGCPKRRGRGCDNRAVDFKCCHHLCPLCFEIVTVLPPVRCVCPCCWF